MKKQKEEVKYIHASTVWQEKGKIYQTIYIPPLLYQIILSCEEVDNLI